MKREKITKSLKGFKGTESLSNNQVVVTFDNAIVFESYGTLIAIKKDGKLYVTKDYDYSRTTSRYLNEFCGRTSKEIAKELENKNPDIVLLK